MNKQRKNVYDPDYIAMRESITYDEAVLYIAQYKKNKSTSLQNFITKYGLTEGTEKWNTFCSKTLKKGWDSNGSHRSKRSPLYYIHHGMTEADAQDAAKQFQHETSSLHVEYYIIRGYTLEYARKKIRSIHDKKLGIDSLIEKLKVQHPEKTLDELLLMRKQIRNSSSIDKIGYEAYSNKIQKTRTSCELTGKWIPLSDMSDYDLYKRIVWQVTNQQDLHLLEHYDSRGLAGVEGAYQLDHKYSISAGYINGVPPEVIGSIKNLEMLPWRENIAKQHNCSTLIENIT